MRNVLHLYVRMFRNAQNTLPKPSVWWRGPSQDARCPEPGSRSWGGSPCLRVLHALCDHIAMHTLPGPKPQFLHNSRLIVRVTSVSLSGVGRCIYIFPLFFSIKKKKTENIPTMRQDMKVPPKNRHAQLLTRRTLKTSVQI